MLNIKAVQSVNSVYISGILTELDIREGRTKDGRDYVSGSATVRVEQEIKGIAQESEIPIRMFSMKYKANGDENPIYSRILGYKDNFVSLAATPEDNPEMASKITISNGRLEENIWLDRTTGEPRTGFQISANFLNAARNTDDDGANFDLTGVVVSKIREVDSEGNETGRLKIKVAVVGYNGRTDVIDLVTASESDSNFIEMNWENGDTVSLHGAVSMSQSTKIWYEEQGFGEPIKRTRTQTHRELIVLSGSGFDEAMSYDSDDIKAALADRQTRVENMKNQSQNKTASKNTVSDFGF